MVYLIQRWRAWRSAKRLQHEVWLLEKHVERLRRAKVVRMPPHHSTRRNGTESVP